MASHSFPLTRECFTGGLDLSSVVKKSVKGLGTVKFFLDFVRNFFATFWPLEIFPELDTGTAAI